MFYKASINLLVSLLIITSCDGTGREYTPSVDIYLDWRYYDPDTDKPVGIGVGMSSEASQKFGLMREKSLIDDGWYETSIYGKSDGIENLLCKIRFKWLDNERAIVKISHHTSIRCNVNGIDGGRFMLNGQVVEFPEIIKGKGEKDLLFERLEGQVLPLSIEPAPVYRQRNDIARGQPVDS